MPAFQENIHYKDMKVLYVTGIFSTKYGGFEKYIIQLLRCGIELSVVFNNNPQPDCKLPKLAY